MTPENERESAAGSGARTGADDAGAPSDATRAEPHAARPEATQPEAARPDAARGGQDGGRAVTSEDADASQTAAPGDPAAASESDPEPAGEPPLEERLATAEALAAAHWDRLVRLQAEIENQRKRAQRDVGNARKFALEGIAEDLLPVRDSLELGIRAAAAEEANLASLLQGSELTLKMLSQVLEKHGIAVIDPDGERFDPEFHQAMSMQEVEGVAPNTVTGVMQKGYTLNERLLRPALVMVAK